ncbi:hypothetical protein D3C77_733680 [compost metagenome]
MFFTHQPLLQNAKLAVKGRLGESLPPGAALTQQLGGFQRKLLQSQLTVRPDNPFQHRRIEPFSDQIAKALAELVEFGLFQRQSGRHGVATELHH